MSFLFWFFFFFSFSLTYLDGGFFSSWFSGFKRRCSGCVCFDPSVFASFRQHSDDIWRAVQKGLGVCVAATLHLRVCPASGKSVCGRVRSPAGHGLGSGAHRTRKRKRSSQLQEPLPVPRRFCSRSGLALLQGYAMDQGEKNGGATFSMFSLCFEK